MKTQSRSSLSRVLLAAFPLLLLPAWSAEPAAPGAEKPRDPSEDAVIELFPGTVVTDDLEANGYFADKSLAGARVNLPMVDTAIVPLTSPPKVDIAIETGRKDKEQEDVLQLSPFCVETTGSLGAKVGGAQDTNYFRDVVKRGGFPHPDTLTAEGLFSEYDLPLPGRAKGRDLLTLNGGAMPASLLARPEVRYLAQVGFSSRLDAATWRREPLNLVAVVDKSGSMSGEPLELVKRSLHQVLSQLGDKDQLSIVLYGDRSHVHLEPTRATRRNRTAISDAIDAIESAGSTNMEEGLLVGFELARRSQRGFTGRTRVMQFTDERPNTGDTSPEGFMGIMKAGSLDGIGQTTIGVGVQFDAELASTISTVRGGNLFYFADADEMKKTFADELDMMVTELAYDMSLQVKPAPGLRLAGVYGLPGEMLEWVGDSEVRFKVSTIFLSKRKGAIYLAFAPANPDLPAARPAAGGSVGTVSLSYLEIDAGAPVTSRLELPLLPILEAGLGLVRGEYLVNEFLILREAMTAHLTEDNQEKAYRLLAGLDQRLAGSDRALRKERKLVGQLLGSMGQLAGHGGEPARHVAKVMSGEDAVD